MRSYRKALALCACQVDGRCATGHRGSAAHSVHSLHLSLVSYCLLLLGRERQLPVITPDRLVPRSWQLRQGTCTVCGHCVVWQSNCLRFRLPGAISGGYDFRGNCRSAPDAKEWIAMKSTLSISQLPQLRRTQFLRWCCCWEGWAQGLALQHRCCCRHCVHRTSAR